MVFQRSIAACLCVGCFFFAAGASAQSSPEKGILEVNTEPQGADVTLGASSPEFRQTLGQTPLRTEMEAGTVQLTLSLDGYETAVAEIEVLPGKTALMQVKLEENVLKSRSALRLAGHLLLWPGLVAAGTGIALIAVESSDRSRNTGMPGYITAGVGTAMTVAGALILGLTYRSKSVYQMPAVSLSVAPDGSGGGVLIQKTF